jgi:hypothetical protein
MVIVKKILYAIPIIIFLNSIGIENLLSVIVTFLFIFLFKNQAQELFIKIISCVLAILEFLIYYQKGIITNLHLINDLIRGMIGAFT